MNIAHLTLQDKWDFLTKYSERFEWTSQTAQDYIPESSVNMTSETKKPRETWLAAEPGKPQPIALFVLLGDMRALGSDAVPGLSPCWDHIIHIVQSRDIPLDPKDVKPPLAKWKFHRWLKWAVSRNMIDLADYFVPIRYLKVISPLKECNRSVGRDKSDVAGNLISSNEIERSDKFTRRMRSQRISDLPTASKEEAKEDVNRWIDFNKIASYVTEVYLFYKLEYFQQSIRVTDILKIASENHKSETAKAASIKETEKEKADIYNNIGKILKSRYKPLYLFCDSPKKKFFLVNLCAAPKKKNDLHKKNYLILEKYNWFFISDSSDQSITISTTGNKSTIVELEAGRQLLQIHSRLDSGLMIISSDTDFYLGDRATVQQLMTSESNRIEQISKIISDNLCKAYRSFGTRNYPSMLKNFYQSYMPNLQFASSKENKNFRTLIHHFFMEEQVRLIKEIVSEEELQDILHSLKIFFLNPRIRLESLDLMTNRNIFQNLAIRETSKIWFSTSGNCEEVLDQAATTIQSFLKMAVVKGYKKLHNPDHAFHTQIRERLLKISALFDLSLASRLLRNVINRHDSLRDLYPCSEDFIHVLNIQEFKGILKNIRYEQYFPIVRLVVNPKPKEAVLAAFELLIDLPRFALRVFNNQNGREMTRLVNHVIPTYYEYLPDGYTVFAYSWSDKHFKEFDWTIRVITMKGDPILYQLDEQQPLSLEIKPPRLKVDELIGTYIPNVRDCILRCILQTTSKRSIVSIRLTTSYNLTEIRIKVADEDGNILIDVNGDSTVLLPLVILKHTTRNEEDYRTENNSQDIKKKKKNAKKKNLYYIEAFVFNNSWPLTNVEWTVANQAKMKRAENIKIKIQSGNKASSRSGLSTMRKDTKQFASDVQALEPPYWILQVVTDARDVVEIYEDKSKEQEIILLKEMWWLKDPSQAKRGKNLRKAFLNAHASKIESDVFSNQNGIQLKLIEDEDMEFCLSHARQYRTLKPLESYHYLPALDLTKYMENEYHRIKTKSDDKILKNQHTAIITDDQINDSDYLKNLDDLMNKQLRRHLKHFGKKEKNFWQKRSFVDAVYETRKIYINSLIAEKVKNETNGKKN
ncbi:Calpain-7-like protein [Trachymyrmex cornetzi]|uniref:Calpain-7-like protein n=2 Tax=Trachymyrmex cornetzi TaxID=471704 RepID=A0A195DSJ4_9HYME|nr:Calpain-7-like protein [Trachymyrmex cornetzi]